MGLTLIQNDIPTQYLPNIIHSAPHKDHRDFVSSPTQFWNKFHSFIGCLPLKNPTMNPPQGHFFSRSALQSQVFSNCSKSFMISISHSSSFMYSWVFLELRGFKLALSFSSDFFLTIAPHNPPPKSDP